MKHITLVPDADPPADAPVSAVPPSQENIVYWQGVTYLDLDPDKMLTAAMGKLDGVIIIGYVKGGFKDKSSNNEYFASSMGDGAVINWLLQRAIFKLHAMAEGYDVEGSAGAEPDAS